jgi:hypothetical protein
MAGVGLGDVLSWDSSWSQRDMSSLTLATMRCCSGSGERGTLAFLRLDALMLLLRSFMFVH